MFVVSTALMYTWGYSGLTCPRGHNNWDAHRRPHRTVSITLALGGGGEMKDMFRGNNWQTLKKGGGGIY